MTGALMLKNKYETMRLSAVERDIDEAIQRVHEVYGTDLSAFFKKAQHDLQMRAPHPHKPSRSEESDKEHTKT
jgi:hypothetical protein